MDQFKRFNYFLLSTIVLLTSSAGIINLIVDPYRLWELFEIRNFNLSKPEAGNLDHLFKPVHLLTHKYDVLLIGSSRVAFGLNPEYGRLREIGRAYNLAYLGGHLYPIRRNLEHAIFNNPNTKAVILGLDFFSFKRGAPKFPPSFKEYRILRRTISYIDTLKSLFTLDVLFDSISTIKSNYNKPDYELISKNGMRTGMGLVEEINKHGISGRFDSTIMLYLSNARYGDYEYSTENLDELRIIIDLCKQNNIQLFVFINPIHSILMEAIYRTGNWDNYKSWLKDVSEITPYWDFSGYNNITSEAIGDKMHNYWDVSHYRDTIGNKILDIMLDKKSQNTNNHRSASQSFGIYITKDNITSRLDNLNRERQFWLSQNKSMSDWLETKMNH